jgi:hypothetical protein
MLLADAVQAAEGRLYIHDGGWSLCGPDLALARMAPICLSAALALVE